MLTKAASLFTLLIAASATLPAASIDYTDFSSTAGLVFNNGGQDPWPTPDPRVIDNELQLTTTGFDGETTSVWYNQQLDVSDGFTTTFTYQITNPVADGFAFVIQNDPAGTAALGSGGGGLSYYELTHSLAVDFDVFTSRASDIDSCGTAANQSTQFNGGCRLDRIPNPTIFDGGVHTATITWDAESLGLSLSVDNGAYGGSVTLSSDIGNYLGLNDGAAWVGFTAATGGLNQTTDLLNWSVDAGDVVEAPSAPEPATWMLMLIAGGWWMCDRLVRRRTRPSLGESSESREVRQ